MPTINQQKKLAVYVDSFTDTEHFHPLQIKGSSGGRRSSSATIRFAGTPDGSGGINNIVQDPQAFPKNQALINLFENRKVRVYETINDVLIHYGRITAWTAQSNPDKLVLTSRSDGHLFSDPIDKPHYKTAELGTQRPDMPIVFNPIVDGLVFGNRSRQTLLGGDAALNFWHPDEEEPTDTLLTPVDWTLAYAVAYLFQFSNINWVTAPTVSQIQTMLGTGPPVPRNLFIPRGVFLPEALNILLKPAGYDFKFEPVENGTPAASNASNELVIWKRETGISAIPSADIYIDDQFADPVVSGNSNLMGCDAEIDVADNAATEIQVVGDPVRQEGTFDLVPTWLESDETTDEKTLELGSKEWESNPALSRVFRDYAVNENGLYPMQDVFDLDAFFGGSVQLRRGRKFYPTLTLGTDGKPVGPRKGIRVEFTTDSGATWQIFNGEYRILPNELGIRIVSQKLHFSMTPTGGMQLRVTATVESDQRLRVTTGAVSSKLMTDKVVVIETRDKYKKQTIHESSIYYDDPTFTSNAVDDTVAIQELATRLRESYRKSRIGGTIKVHDSDWRANDWLGKRIVQFDGRDIDFRADPGGNYYPVVIGFAMDFQTQTTTLMLEKTA